jgi:putative restriction endonuclease
MAGDNVFVIPADPVDFEATVTSPVGLDEFDDVPEPLSELDRARIWSVPEDGNGDLFEEMVADDLLLFYHDGRYVGIGKVGTRFRDDEAWAAERLWQTTGSEFVYTVESFEAVNLSRAAVHAIFDYSANYYPGTPMRVPDDRVTNDTAAIYEAVTRYDRESRAA